MAGPHVLRTKSREWGAWGWSPDPCPQGDTGRFLTLRLSIFVEKAKSQGGHENRTVVFPNPKCHQVYALLACVRPTSKGDTVPCRVTVFHGVSDPSPGSLHPWSSYCSSRSLSFPVCEMGNPSSRPAAPALLSGLSEPLGTACSAVTAQRGTTRTSSLSFHGTTAKLLNIPCKTKTSFQVLQRHLLQMFLRSPPLTPSSRPVPSIVVYVHGYTGVLIRKHLRDNL